MSKRELKQLAKLIFQLTRRENWLGGKGKISWPKDIVHITWNHKTTWTLSPEVEIGGHRMRICISMPYSHEFHYNTHHVVWVFVDGDLKYPGGNYSVSNWWPWMFWSKRIAYLERDDGGQSGPVDKRDLLIKEAINLLETPVVEHEPAKSPEALAAELEVENMLKQVQLTKRLSQ